MTVSYNGLIGVNFSNPLDLVKSIKRAYGGSNFEIGVQDHNENHIVITFDENLPEEAKGLPLFQRAKFRNRRMMHVFINGECKSDYAELTDSDMTYVSLGHNGHCEKIIRPLVELFGGFIKNEAVSDDWVRV